MKLEAAAHDVDLLIYGLTCRSYKSTGGLVGYEQTIAGKQNIGYGRSKAGVSSSNLPLATALWSPVMALGLSCDLWDWDAPYPEQEDRILYAGGGLCRAMFANAPVNLGSSGLIWPVFHPSKVKVG